MPVARAASSIIASRSAPRPLVRLEVHRRVGEVQRAAGSPGDLDHLAVRLQRALAVRPLVRAVVAAVRRDDRAQLDQFVGGREHAGGVGEAAAHPDRALLAGPRRAAASSRPARRGWPGGSSVPTTIIRSVPCGTRYAALQAMPWSSRSRYPATVRPAEVEVVRFAVPAGDLAPDRGPGRVVDRRERQAVLAEHLQRDALADLRRVVRVRQDLQVGVGVHVDEARATAPGRPRRSSGGRAGRSLPMATIRPPSTATSARTPGAPVPSSTVAPVISRSVIRIRRQKKVRTRSTTTGSSASGSSTTGISPHLSNAVHGCDRPTPQLVADRPPALRRRSAGSRAGRSAWSTVIPSAFSDRLTVRARPDQLWLGQVLVERQVALARVEDRQSRLGLRGDPDPAVHRGNQSVAVGPRRLTERREPAISRRHA